MFSRQEIQYMKAAVAAIGGEDVVMVVPPHRDADSVMEELLQSVPIEYRDLVKEHVQVKVLPGSGQGNEEE